MWGDAELKDIEDLWKKTRIETTKIGGIKSLHSLMRPRETMVNIGVKNIEAVADYTLHVTHRERPVWCQADLHQ